MGRRLRSSLFLIVGAALVLGFFANTLVAQEVIQVTWPTRHAAPAASATPEVAAYLPLMRATAQKLPESAVVKLALTQSTTFGMSSADSEKLSDLVARRYAAIATSPVFKNVPSTLPYTLAETQPRQGLALVYRPQRTTAQTPVILFLHGYGGSFIWYQHQLAEWFPDHLIICPAYGIDPSEISAAYVTESLAAVSAKLKHPLAKPSLIGLSAGGFGATRLYSATPSAYQRLVVLAAYPPDDAFRAWPKAARAAWIVGAQEYYVKDGGFATYVKSLTARSTRFQSLTIPKADHFFLLTHPTETRRALKSWLEGADRL
ncbi:MAG: alpha/beta hydrolase [Rariglobus sp.]